jgi:hypothetical protein
MSIENVTVILAFFSTFNVLCDSVNEAIVGDWSKRGAGIIRKRNVTTLDGVHLREVTMEENQKDAQLIITTWLGIYSCDKVVESHVNSKGDLHQ